MTYAGDISLSIVKNIDRIEREKKRLTPNALFFRNIMVRTIKLMK